ncbi:MAG TPA: CotH kinase family protein [Planctomycetota bacterium]|nr:CotH kinase family protein [Planctomycetota bacterium]
MHRLWTWSFVPGLLFLAWLIAWLMPLLEYFVTFGIYRNVDPIVVRLGETGHRDLDHRLWVARLWFAPRSPAATHDQQRLRDVRLSVAPEHLVRLDADLPYSGRDHVPGTLQIGPRTLAAEVRYRGDTLVHWGRAKKSFRIRTREGEAIAGMPTFNLIVGKYPEQLNNYLSERLAQSLGLLAPRVELVNVYLNGSFHGLYQLVEQPGEAMLRAAGRQAGDLYVGDLLLRDAWTGIPNDLFTSNALWQRSTFGASRSPGDAPLAALIAAVNEPASETSMRRLGELLDLDQFARLSVLEQLTQSHHNDHFHNWRLFWDPKRRKFEPLVWDLVGWQETMRPATGCPIDLHPVFSPLHARLHEHAGFLVARDRVLHEFYANGKDRELLAVLDWALAAVAAPQAADPNLEPPDDAVVGAAQSDFAAFVRFCVAELHDRWFNGPELLSWRRAAAADQPLQVQLMTVRPVRALRLRFTGAVQPSRVTLGIPRPEGTAIADLPGMWHVDGNDVVVAVALVSALDAVFAWRDGSPTIRNVRRNAVPTCFELTLDDVDMRSLVEVREDGTTRGFVEDAGLVATPVHGLFAVVPR